MEIFLKLNRGATIPPIEEKYNTTFFQAAVQGLKESLDFGGSIICGPYKECNNGMSSPSDTKTIVVVFEYTEKLELVSSTLKQLRKDYPQTIIIATASTPHKKRDEETRYLSDFEKITKDINSGFVNASLNSAMFPWGFVLTRIAEEYVRLT